MMKTEDFSNFTQSNLLPGQLLKAARETQNIPLEAVSKHLHLTVATIQSIEDDKYQKMPAPVYVRGYLRRYAQFLKLPTNKVLEAYEENVEIKSKIIEEIPSYLKKTPITSSHLSIRLLTIGIVLVLLILVGLWWKGYDRIEKNPAIPSEVKTSNLPFKMEPAQETPTPSEPKKENLNDLLPETKNPDSPKASKLKESQINPNVDINKNIKPSTDRNENKEKGDTRPSRQPSNTLDLY